MGKHYSRNGFHQKEDTKTGLIIKLSMSRYSIFRALDLQYLCLRIQMGKR